MKLFKSSLIGLLLSFSLLAPSATFAAATPAPAKKTVPVAATTQTKLSTTPPTSLVATVNIEDARIMSQKGNDFMIGFTLTNRQGLQSGVKYGVQLVADGAKYISDEKVYDASLTLYENSKAKEEIAYSAPTFLGGSYTLLLVSRNESNLPLATVSLGKVKLTATTKGVQILNDSCFLQVMGEASLKHYTLTEGVDIDKNENLSMTCTGVNNEAQALTLTPVFETRHYSAYGKLTTAQGGGYKAISFAKGEKKVFTIALPKNQAPSTYSLKISLLDAKSTTNTISAIYVVRGITANIQKISLDKDYYTVGDNGQMTVLWSVLTGNYKRSASKGGTVAPVTTFNAKIVASSGGTCADLISQKLVRDMKDPQAHIVFTVKAPCLNPVVVATIKDELGNTLFEKNFGFLSNPATAPKNSNKIPVAVIIVVILAVIGLGVYMKKKKNN